MEIRNININEKGPRAVKEYTRISTENRVWQKKDEPVGKSVREAVRELNRGYFIDKRV